MEDLTSVWRPVQRLRATAIGIIRRDERLLVTAVTQDDGRVTGWRPPGGGIEFGERAADAVIREIREELDAEARVLRPLGVIENLFTHQGSTGHEMVFAFEVALLTPGITRPDRFVVEDSGYRDQAAWMPLAAFRNGSGRTVSST
jgi:ADP-ribose pyrophosphatase YjhB (NUDIX family)